MNLVRAAFTGLILFVLAIIGVQNPTLITLRFLGWQTGVLPLWVIMVSALVSGMLLVGIATLPGRIGRYRTTRRLQRQLAVAGGSAHHPPTLSTESSPAAPAQPGRMELTP